MCTEIHNYHGWIIIMILDYQSDSVVNIKIISFKTCYRNEIEEARITSTFQILTSLGSGSQSYIDNNFLSMCSYMTVVSIIDTNLMLTALVMSNNLIHDKHGVTWVFVMLLSLFLLISTNCQQAVIIHKFYVASYEVFANTVLLTIEYLWKIIIAISHLRILTIVFIREDIFINLLSLKKKSWKARTCYNMWIDTSSRRFLIKLLAMNETRSETKFVWYPILLLNENTVAQKESLVFKTAHLPLIQN